jgi:hypothetical protein
MVLAMSTVSISAAGAQDAGATLRYQQWAAQHSDWVRLHPDRARFFASHEDAAERARHEWSDWQGNKTQFNTWAETHPGWVSSHKQRYDQFQAHPDLAEKQHQQWRDHRESKNEFNSWNKAHAWSNDGVGDHHDNGRHAAEVDHHDNGHHDGEGDHHDNGNHRGRRGR